MIGLLDKFVAMVKQCFNSDQYFERQRFSAFEQFLNRDREITGKISMAEMLATYTDNILRKNGIRLPEDQ